MLSITDNARAVHYDPRDKKIYWMERMDTGGRIRRALMDGSSAEDVATSVDCTCFLRILLNDLFMY